MEKNGHAVLGTAAVAAGIGFDELDAAVGVFGHGICEAVFHVGGQPR